MRRYGALRPAERFRVAAAFVLAQAVLWVFFGHWVVRAVLALLTAAVLAVVVVTRPPTRRTSRR